MWLLAVTLKTALLKIKMAEELQKYKDILKREQDEFKKQLVREVRTSRFFLFQ